MAKSTVGSLWINIKANTMGLAKGLGKSRGMLGKFGKFASSPAGIATASFAGLTAGIYAMGRALVASIKQWMDFSKAMSEVRSILLDVSNDQFKRLTEQAKLLGATTANTATEIAGAMTNLARAGFDTSEIEASVKSVSDLANATGMEMSEASDLIAVGVRAFGFEAREATRVADVLAMTASKTNTSVTELGEGMKYVAPVAKQLGFSIEETSAMLGKLADAGIKGTMGGTALRKIFLMLGQDIEKHGTKAFFDFMSTQQGVIKNFEKFGARAVTSAGVLQDVSSEVAELTEELDKASGTAQRMAEIQLDNLSGDVTLLNSAISGLALAIGEELDDSMRGATQTATGFISALTAGFNALDENVKKTSVTTEMWNGILLGLATIVIAVVGVLKFLINAVEAIAIAIAGLISGALSGLGMVIGFLYDGVQAFFGLFMDTSGWDEVGNVIWDMQKELANQSFNLFKRADEEAREGMNALTNGITSSVKAEYEVLFGTGKVIGKAVGDGASKGIEESTDKNKKKLKEGVDKLLEEVRQLVPSLQEQINTFGMGKAEALAYALAQKEVTSELVDQAVVLENQLEALKEKQKADQKLASDAKNVIESLRTPKEIYDSEVSNLQKMVDAKLLTLEQFEKAVSNLKTDTEDEIEINIVTKGVVEGLQTALGTVKIAGEVDKTEQIAEKTLSVQKNMESLTEAVKQSTKKTADVLSGTVETEVNGLQQAVTSGVSSATVTANMNADVLEELAKKNNDINEKGFESVVQELKNINSSQASPLT